jgi:hypothetical protein
MAALSEPRRRARRPLDRRQREEEERRFQQNVSREGDTTPTRRLHIGGFSSGFGLTYYERNGAGMGRVLWGAPRTHREAIRAARMPGVEAIYRPVPLARLRQHRTVLVSGPERAEDLGAAKKEVKREGTDTRQENPIMGCTSVPHAPRIATAERRQRTRASAAHSPRPPEPPV